MMMQEQTSEHLILPGKNKSWRLEITRFTIFNCALWVVVVSTFIMF